MDELHEFPRSVLESPRQPIEDGCVSVARVGGHAMFPARFQLVGTINLYWRRPAVRSDSGRRHRLTAAPTRSTDEAAGPPLVTVSLWTRRRDSGWTRRQPRVIAQGPRVPSRWPRLLRATATTWRSTK